MSIELLVRIWSFKNAVVKFISLLRQYITNWLIYSVKFHPFSRFLQKSNVENLSFSDAVFISIPSCQNN